MRYVIIGAGAVGGTIGARLFQSGHEVVLVARGAHLAAMREHGLRFVTPEEDVRLAVPAVAGPEELGALRADDVLVLCVKSQDTAGVLAAWATAPVVGGGTASERIPLVCAQNGVDNERVALRTFEHVYGLCVWLPSQHLEPGVIGANCVPQTGILTVGRYPEGVDELITAVGADLAASRFDAPVVDDVMRWKYGKLLNNVGNAVQAVAGVDADPAAARRIVEAVVAEGKEVLRAAGIPFVDALERHATQGDRMVFQEIPGMPRSGGSTWQSLARGSASVETAFLNGEISLEARLHGVAAPVNALLYRLSTEFAVQGRAPGSMPVSELAALVEAAAKG
jgi:2-dehydropantoate 2-reductase